MKKLFTLLLATLSFSTIVNGQAGLLISELLPNPNGTDSPFEYVELVATQNINFATTPYTIVFLNSGTATSNGWKEGKAITYAFQINTGSVTAGQVVYVGGSSMLPLSNSGVSIRTINTSSTAGDGFGNSGADVLGNGGSNCDGIAVFNMSASSITGTKVPVDALFYGTDYGSAYKTSGSGYQLPVNDKYNGGKLLKTSYLAPDPGADQLVKATAGTYNPTTGTFSTARNWSITSTPTYNSSSITLSGSGNQAPTVSITAPSNNATYIAPASVNITATVADADGTISKVELYNGSTLLTTLTASPYTYAWTNVATGSYSLTAKAYDNSTGITTSSVVNISVNASGNASPTVSITSPTNNATFTAPATVAITATASDSDGSIAKVELYNGATLLTTLTSAPYTYSWTSVAAGSYSLTAKAYDNLNAVTTSSAINITVNSATNAVPTLTFLPNASKLINESSGKISCVMGNSTDPVIVSGLDINVTDESLSTLTFTMTSSKTSVVANANFTVVGTGNARKFKITPSAVGYATITLKVTDNGGKTASISFSLAVSNKITTSTVKDVYHTGMSDGSTAVLIDANYMFVADDETNQIRLYDRNNSGLPLYQFDVTSYLALSGKEIDIEGSFISPTKPNRIYWLGSMSNNKDAESRPDRNRLFATDIVGSGATATLTFVGYTSTLRSKIITWGDNNGYNFTAKAAAGVDPKTIGGFNIEGFEMGPDGTTAFIAFRAPYVGSSTNKGLICPLTNFETWFNNGSPSGNPTFGTPIELSLGTRGIRSLGKNSSNEYVIVAGPFDDNGTFALYKWNGLAASAPTVLTATLTGLRPEGIVEIPASLSGTFQLQLISDLGSTIWYADAIENKDLTENNYKKFMSSVVNVTNPSGRFASTDVTDNSATLLTISPNPDNSSIKVEYPQDGNSTLQLTDAMGNQILSQEFTSGNSVDLSSLPAGVYILQIRTEGENYTQRVIKY